MVKNTMICPICGASLKSNKTFNEHVKKHNEDQKQCEECDYKGTAKNLWQHKKSIHEENKFPCGICGKVMPNKSDLNRHMKSIHEFEPHRKVTQSMEYSN